MTRKDFELIATALRQARPLRESIMYGGWRLAVERISVALSTTNPRFDRAVFMAAAGDTAWPEEAG